MLIAGIPIEYREQGKFGLVRQEGIRGQKLPNLEAYDPEPWRFFRMARIVGATKAIAEVELGQDQSTALVEAMEAIADVEGEFTVVWRSSAHAPAFESIVERAVVSQGEHYVNHLINRDQ